MPSSRTLKFGIGNYINFTFRFQLGSSNAEPTTSGTSDLTLTNQKNNKRTSTIDSVYSTSKSVSSTLQPTQLMKSVYTQGRHPQPRAKRVVKSPAPTKPIKFASAANPSTFLTIPPEIRQIIYTNLLLSKNPIKDAHNLLGNNRSIELAHYNPILDINATVLRTCKAVYKEALPILYGQNTFFFSDPDHILDFKEKSMPRTREYDLGTFVCRRFPNIIFS